MEGTIVSMDCEVLIEKTSSNIGSFDGADCSFKCAPTAHGELCSSNARMHKLRLIPYNFDQPDNAARMARVGVGRVISRASYSARRVASDLESLVGDPTYTKNAQEIGKVVERENGAVTACNALQKLLVQQRARYGKATLSGLIAEN
jgi:hypothetical protein